MRSKRRGAMTLLFLLAGLLCLTISDGRAVEPGDINDDGVRTFTDVFQTSGYLVGRAGGVSAASAADANADGSVDAGDVVWILNRLRKPQVVSIQGRIEPPLSFSLDPQTLRLSSAAGEVSLDAQWRFADFSVWEEGAGQFLQLKTASSGSPILIYYLNPSERDAGPIVLTSRHAAQGILGLHPVCFTLKDDQRRQWLALAQLDPDFPLLVALIDERLRTSPGALGSYDTSAPIFDLAARIAQAASLAWSARDAVVSRTRDVRISRPVIGNPRQPYLDDWPGNGMTIVNPTYLFYGAKWGEGDDALATIRGIERAVSLLEDDASTQTEARIPLPDGTYTVEISTDPLFELGVDPAGMNTVELILAVLSSYFPPGWDLPPGGASDGEWIEALIAANPPQLDELVALWVTYSMGSDDPSDLLVQIVDLLINGGTYEGSLFQWLARTFFGFRDGEAMALWLQLPVLRTLISSWSSCPGLVPGENLFDSLFEQVVEEPHTYVFVVVITDGRLTSVSQQVSPAARLTVSADFPRQGETVTFDASASQDDEDYLTALEFRFDFENDGTWDTAWATGDPIATHAYPTEGTKRCVVEVRDTDGLTGRAFASLHVLSESDGTISIDVTPDTGAWRLFGPAGFTTVDGVGDRLSGESIVAPGGTYTLACLDVVPGYVPPAPLTATLVAGNPLTFRPTYSVDVPNPEMISIPGGIFAMGPRDDGDDLEYRESDELPRHSVTLSPYSMGRYEVTNGEYASILNWAHQRNYLRDAANQKYTGGSIYHNGQLILIIGGAGTQIAYEDGWFVTIARTGEGGTVYPMVDHPVVRQTWYGSVAFCNWLSQAKGLTPCYNLSTWTGIDMDPVTEGIQFTNGYRLPTEAEWERAAAWNGTSHAVYGFQSDTLTGRDRCNYDTELGAWPDNLVNPQGLEGQPFTGPVGWFDGFNVSPNGGIATVDSPSPAGCYDMSGNTREWCYDWYDAAYYASSLASNPPGASSGIYRVTRGGSWMNPRENQRTADRGSLAPGLATIDAGFRLVRSE